MSYRVIIDDMSNYSNMTREEKASIFADTPFTISGGDIPSILGINPYKGGSNVDLYYKKINKTKVPQNDAMLRGHDFETAIKLLFKWEYKDIFQQQNFNGMVRSVETPYLTGVPDDILVSQKDIETTDFTIPAGTKFVQEIKSKFISSKASGFKNLSEMFDHFIYNMNPFYEVQQQLYMHIMNIDYGIYTSEVVMAPRNSEYRRSERKSQILVKDNKKIDLILEECEKFYKCLISKTPPAIKQRKGI